MIYNPNFSVTLLKTICLISSLFFLNSCSKDEPVNQKNITPDNNLKQWFVDADGDGYGNPDINLGKESFNKPLGFVQNDGDCNDDDKNVNPDAEEDEYDGIDSDCDNKKEDIYSTISKTLENEGEEYLDYLTATIKKFLFPTPDGGYISIGTSNGLSENSFANVQGLWIIKFNSELVKEWEKIYNGNENLVRLNSAKQTSDGGYILFGSKYDPSLSIGRRDDWWILKIDANGETEWTKTMGGTSDDYGSDIIETNDGGYLTVGRSHGNNGDFPTQNGTSQDSWFVKLDIHGNIEWKTKTNGINANNIIQLEDNTYFSVSGSNTGLKNEIQLLKLNTSGEIIWSNSFKTEKDINYHILNKILLGPNKNVLISGYISGSNGSIRDLDGVLINITLEGELNWIDYLGHRTWDKVNSIITSNDNQFYFAIGSISAPEKSNTDIWIAKYTLTGERVWENYIGSDLNDFAGDLIQIEDSGFIVTGSTSGYDEDIIDRDENTEGIAFWVTKLKPNGKL